MAQGLLLRGLNSLAPAGISVPLPPLALLVMFFSQFIVRSKHSPKNVV
jgi:hypothetical protein